MPSEAATDPELVQDLLRAGMDFMGIDCAHDAPEQWSARVAKLRQAEPTVGPSCRVQAELSPATGRTASPTMSR